MSEAAVQRGGGQAVGTAPGRVRWRLVFWVFVVAAVAYLDRINIAVAASAIQKEFGLSDIHLGWVFSAFVLGYALSQPVAGRLADRFGPYRLIAGAIVWWSVFTALVPLAPTGMAASFAILLTLRLLLGIGESVIFPASNRLVASWIPCRERGLANGLIFAGVGVGGGLAPPLITFVMLSYGWRAAFFVSAAIGLVICVVWLFVAKDRPEDHKGVGPAEAAYIRDGIPPLSRAPGPPTPWRRLFLDRHVAALTLSYFCYGYVAYIFFTWFFKYLSDVRGLDLKSSAIYATLPFIAMAVASSLGGWISDRLLRISGPRIARCGMAGLSLAAAAVFVWSATQVEDPRLAALVLAGGAGALYLAQSAYWAVAADIGGRSAGSLSGVMNMGSQLGGVVTASLTPYIAGAYGWTASFVFAAAVCAVGAAAWALVDPTHSVLKGDTQPDPASP